MRVSIIKNDLKNLESRKCYCLHIYAYSFIFILSSLSITFCECTFREFIAIMADSCNLFTFMNWNWNVSKETFRSTIARFESVDIIPISDPSENYEQRIPTSIYPSRSHGIIFLIVIIIFDAGNRVIDILHPSIVNNEWRVRYNFIGSYIIMH